MYSNLTFLTPSISNSCLYVLNNRLPGLARYLQAVLIVSNFMEDLINLNLKKKNSGMPVEETTCVKYLGLIIDCQLNWKKTCTWSE